MKTRNIIIFMNPNDYYRPKKSSERTPLPQFKKLLLLMWILIVRKTILLPEECDYYWAKREERARIAAIIAENVKEWPSRRHGVVYHPLSSVDQTGQVRQQLPQASTLFLKNESSTLHLEDLGLLMNNLFTSGRKMMPTNFPKSFEIPHQKNFLKGVKKRHI